MRKAIVILACWCACGVIQAQAQTYYVSPQPGGGAVIYNMFDPVGQGQGPGSVDRDNPVNAALDSFERTRRLCENNRRQIEERRRERTRELDMRQRGLVP